MFDRKCLPDLIPKPNATGFYCNLAFHALVWRLATPFATLLPSSKNKFKKVQGGAALRKAVLSGFYYQESAGLGTDGPTERLTDRQMWRSTSLPLWVLLIVIDPVILSGYRLTGDEALVVARRWPRHGRETKRFCCSLWFKISLSSESKPA